jgi:hypothetical protein
MIGNETNEEKDHGRFHEGDAEIVPPVRGGGVGGARGAVERAMKDSGDNYVNRAWAHVLETLGKSNSASSRVRG